MELGLRSSNVSTTTTATTTSSSRDTNKTTAPSFDGKPSNNNSGSLLSDAPYTVPSSTDLSQPKIVVPSEYAGKKEIVITENSLLFVTQASEKLYNNIKELAKFKVKAEKRLAIQRLELSRQVQELKRLCDRIEHQNIQEEQREKILTAAQSHGKLALRVDSVLRKVMGSYLPELSNDEKKWAEGLQEIQKTMDGDRGYHKRIEMVSKVFFFLLILYRGEVGIPLLLKRCVMFSLFLFNIYLYSYNLKYRRCDHDLYNWVDKMKYS